MFRNEYSTSDGIPITYSVVESNLPRNGICKGTLTKLSHKAVEALLESPVETFSNLEMRLDSGGAERDQGTHYGKIMGAVPGTEAEFSICFTSIPPEIDSFFRSLLARAPAVEQKSKGPTKRKRSSPKSRDGQLAR
jgi:hypothetical protein